MSRRLRLRRWQRDALALLNKRQPTDFMVTATPGAGKTTFGLVAMLQFLKDHPHARLVVVTPTRSLKTQWTAAAAEFGLELVDDWDGGRLPSDAHGIVVTYAGIGSRPEDVARIVAEGGALIDEIHHAGTERTWGDGLAGALGGAARRIALSGTPWRGDTNPIPFVHYDDAGVAVPDFAYGYAEALADGGVVRPVFFPRLGGNMEWVSAGGELHSATFEDPLDRKGASHRLRTALSPDGGWLHETLSQANDRLRTVRADDPYAGGIVFAMDQEHARGVAKLLHQITGEAPVLAISDESDAQDRLAAFATSAEPWAVCVRYASEGYDAPRLRVGVYATNVIAPLFWNQAVGRIVRWRAQAGSQQAAWMFLPDDPRLRELALSIKEQRTHVLRAKEDAEDPDEREQVTAEESEQLSLFAAVHSEAEGELRGDRGDAATDPWFVPHLQAPDVDDPTLEMELPPPPGGREDDPDGTPGSSRAQLRQRNTDKVTLIATLTGLGHREINARLNRSAGIAQVSEATKQELGRRIAEADKWLRRL